jgi:hypothetical protein
MTVIDRQKVRNGAVSKARQTSHEVPILTLDFRFWRKRPMTDAQAQRVLRDLSEFARRGDLGLRRPLWTQGDETVIPRSRSAMADGGNDEDCVLVSVEYRDCTVEGQQHHCRCELYECSDGSTKWLCTPID